MDFNNEFDNFKKNARDTFNDHKDEAMRYAKRETRKHLDDFLGDDDSNFNTREREHQSRDYETKRKNDYRSSSSYNEEKPLGDNDYYGDNYSYNNSNNHQTENDYFNNDDYNRDDNYSNNDENYHSYNYREHEDEDY